MNPAFIAIGMFNMNPCIFVFKDLKWHAFFNREKYREVRAGAGTDITSIACGYDGGSFSNQRLMHPSLIAFKVLKMIPLTRLLRR